MAVFTMRAMTPKSSSLRTSAAASKIKNKILNTSSFFKVSLKTNNKALAVALETQKERNRLLEKEIMGLQKQVEALCFELATKKYKHRKLLLIMENLRSNTLQHLNLVDDLFSDSDLSKLPEDDVNKADPEVGSVTDQSHPQPEIPGPLLSPVQTVTGDTPKENCPNVFNIQNSTDTSSGNSDVVEKQCMQSPQTGTHSSISLRDEVKRPSIVISQPGLDMKSVLCRQSIQPPSVVITCENLEPSLTDDAHVPDSSAVETERECGQKQEKTVLLNTTMDMTQINATEIVTVETKAKKPNCPSKPKDKKKKKGGASGSSEDPQVKNSADSGLREVQRAPTGTLGTDDQALEDIRVAEFIALQSPKIRRMRANTSRIPKLSNRQEKAKAKSQDKSKPEVCDIVSKDLDDYFMDREIAFSKDRESEVLLPEKDTEDEARSNITCRRTRTRGRRVSSVTRKTFVILPSQLHESESSQPEVEEQHMNNEPESSMKTNSGAFPRCRGTFFISRTDDGNSSISRELGEQDLISSALSSNSQAEEPATVSDSRINQQHSESNPHGHSGGPSVEDTQSSSKHPWPATQDSGSHQGHSCSNSNREICPPDEGRASGEEFQNTKRNRRMERSKSSKRKAVQSQDWVGQLKDKEKKKKKKSCSNKGFRCDDEEHHLVDTTDSLGRDEEQWNDLEVVESHSDICDRNISEHEEDSEPNELHTFIEPRNARETFVVYRRKTQDNVSGNSTRTSDVSHAYSRMMDTSHEPGHKNVGDLLTDEMPPWSAIDVSTADTEVGSLLATPKREAAHRAAVMEEDSPAGRVLTSLTNTISTPDSESRGRTRRRKGVVSYKEPALNIKMRRGDKFTESTFLSFKDGKKKRQKKTAAPNPVLESSVLMD